jgi:aryl-alcohol dehydrogenase (NADP+)
MQYVRLGRTGLKVSRLCLGSANLGPTSFNAWNLGPEAARPVFEAAFEAGINFFDTANVYARGESEKIVGAHLRAMAKRDEYVLATKLTQPMGEKPTQAGLNRKHVFEAVDASLKRLGTDYVDLLVTHRWDPETPVEETLEALNDVVRAGKARYIGASNLYAWQLAKMLFTADRHGWARFVSVQNHYNVIYREEERETVPLCLDQGVAMTPWSPLTRGFVAGNRTQGGGETPRAQADAKARAMYDHDCRFAIAEAAQAIAKARGLTPIQVALAWILGKPAMTAPVVGISRPEQLRELAAAAETRLDADEIAALEAPYRPMTMRGMEL